ncbi:MAG: glycosyltransferase family 2 protein [Planctomycetota bacterium]
MVPTRNGGARFRDCLSALFRQRPAPEAVVVVDSGSEDGTADAARRAGARVVDIAPEDFDHGGTRRLGAAQLPDVDVLVFLVQDAVLQGSDCLATLTAAARRPGVAAATARQLAPPASGPLAAATVASGPFGSASPRRTGPFTHAELSRLTPARWRGLLLLDDVCCAVRGAVFRAAGGFPDTMHGEDVLLAYDLLWAGWALQHEPAAVVEHGHAYDAENVGERYEADARFFRERFGLRVRPGPLSVLKGIRAETARDRRWLAAHGGTAEDARASRALRRAQVEAQRRGSRGALGRLPDPRPLPGPGAET